MNEIYDANVLYKAFRRAMKSAPWKTTSQMYEINALSNVVKAQEEIRNRTYKPSKSSKFIVQERGKTRCIEGRQMHDKVIEHALCDEILTPLVANKLIYDNGASQKGKGVSFTRDRLKTHLHRYYRKYGNQGYVLLIDFSKYYDNILHSIAKQQLKDLCNDPTVSYLIDVLFDTFRVDVSYLEKPEEYINTKHDALKYRELPDELKTGRAFSDKSVSIGDQISQIVGILYPYRIDNYCKIVRGMKYYGRYMDDIYIISNNKFELLEILEGVKIICKELGIFINEKKTQICRIDKGFKWLQHTYILTPSGRVIDKVSKERVHAMRRKIKKLSKMGKPKEEVWQVLHSWVCGYKKNLSNKQIYNLYQLFNEIYPEEKENGECEDQTRRWDGVLRHAQW